jgi:phenylacetate-coenzyme A ligase PaaK-like adenylate-forming protein
MLGRWQQIADLVRAMRIKRRQLDPVLRWTPEELTAHQDRCWRSLARLAAEKAPFYRELYQGIDLERAPLTALPPVEKGDLMERFDETVTEAALRLDELEAYLRGPLTRPFRDRFHVLQTSGSTGRRGIVVYDRPEWVACIAGSLRCQELMGNRPRLLPRVRMATFTSTNLSHISCRLAWSTDIGLYRRLTVDPQEPLEQVLTRLQQFQPEVLFGYPSVILPVLQAQMDGRVRIRPRRIVGGAEAVTPAFRSAVREVWDAEVLDLYATTETGVLSVESTGNQGIYLLEDQTLVEVVDEDDQPVPEGTPGQSALITCLTRRAQPLIRYRLSDQLILDPPPGAGSPPFRRVRGIQGRVEDSLRLRNAQGQEVELRPSLVVEELLALPGARQVQVIQEIEEIQVSLVAAPDQAAALPQAVEEWFRRVAREQNLHLPRLTVRIVSRLGGTEATRGKFRPVECRLPR